MSTVISAKFEFPGYDELLKSKNLEKGGLVQAAIDKAAIDWCAQYTPWQTGTLAKSAYTASSIGDGKVCYPGPYARYLYYGEVYGSNIPVFDDDSGVPTRFFHRRGRRSTLQAKSCNTAQMSTR